MTLSNLAAMTGLCLACTAVFAEAPKYEIGNTARAWMELQKSGEQASAKAPQISGEVAKRSYKRYLSSFEREIPQQFEAGGNAQ